MPALCKISSAGYRLILPEVVFLLQLVSFAQPNTIQFTDVLGCVMNSDGEDVVAFSNQTISFSSLPGGSLDNLPVYLSEHYPDCHNIVTCRLRKIV